MTFDSMLDEIKIYHESLAEIDRKIPLYENSEKRVKECKKELQAVVGKYGIKRLVVYIAIFSLIAYFFLSILFSFLESEINPIFFALIIGTVIALLVKIKYSNTQKKVAEKIAKDLLKTAEEEETTIAQAIYALYKAANNSFSKIMSARIELDICEYDTVYSNLITLDYLFGMMSKNNKIVIASIEIENFKKIIDETKEKNENKELIDSINLAELKTLYRFGVIKHCIKEVEEKENV